MSAGAIHVCWPPPAFVGGIVPAGAQDARCLPDTSVAPREWDLGASTVRSTEPRSLACSPRPNPLWEEIVVDGGALRVEPCRFLPLAVTGRDRAGEIDFFVAPDHRPEFAVVKDTD